MKPEQVVVALTRLEEQMIALRKSVDEHHHDEDKVHKEIIYLIKANQERITSLEHSRTKIKTIIGILATGLLFIGWDAAADWLNHLIK